MKTLRIAMPKPGGRIIIRGLSDAAPKRTTSTRTKATRRNPISGLMDEGTARRKLKAGGFRPVPGSSRWMNYGLGLAARIEFTRGDKVRVRINEATSAEKAATKPKAPKRSNPKRKAPKRSNPKRKAPKRSNPKRKAPKRKAPKRKAPKRKKARNRKTGRFV